MKKLILTASLMVAAVAAFGQGQVNFANNNATRIWADRDANGTTNGADTLLAAGPNSQVAIYGATGSGQPVGSLVIQTTAITNLLTPGFFLGGVRTLSLPTGPATLQVRAWTGSFPNYEAAAAAAVADPSIFIGMSNPLNVTLTTPPSPPPTLLGSGLNQFNVAPVPEPSSIALGLLGLGAIVLFRRRK